MPPSPQMMTFDHAMMPLLFSSFFFFLILVLGTKASAVTSAIFNQSDRPSHEIYDFQLENFE
jgi:hypothetical protein